MAFVLVNIEDNTVNFIGDGDINDYNLCFEGVEVYQIPEKTADEVQNNIPNHECYWYNNEVISINELPEEEYNKLFPQLELTEKDKVIEELKSLSLEEITKLKKLLSE